MSTHREGFDEFGNPIGRAFDLGGVDDERLRGEKILLYVAYPPSYEKYEWHHAQQAVTERNLHMDIVVAQRSGVCTLMEAQLKRYTQLWFVADQTPSLTPNQVKMIVDYVHQGNGLLLWSDNEPYFADTNLLAQPLMGTYFFGNLMADGVMSPGTNLRPGVFVEHPLTAGVNQLYEGITISGIAPAPGVTMLAQSHDGQLCMACFEKGNQRIVMDTGFTKLHEGRFYRTAGTARYFRNIAFWLARGARGIEYTAFTPGREQLATINPQATSEGYRYSVTEPCALTYLLHWEGNATLRLVVQDPSGRTVYDANSSKPPIRANLTATQLGDWVAWVKGDQVPRAKFPYVLTLAKTKTNAPLQPVETRPPRTATPQDYQKPWGSNHPGGLIILLDQSESMKDPFTEQQVGGNRRKCDVVATLLNSLLYDFIRANTVGSVIKPRVEIAVLGYSGASARSALSGPLKGKDFVGLPELMNHPLRVETRKRKEDVGDGTVVEVATQFPVWVEPTIGSATPMCAALQRAAELADTWATAHPDSYPPVVINVTDGASTDGEPTAAARALCEIYTRVGETLLFNCHITNSRAGKVEFPSSEVYVPRDSDGLARLLFQLSSPIPEPARLTLMNTTQVRLEPGARGFIFNGDAASIRQMFVFATVAAAFPGVDPDK